VQIIDGLDSMVRERLWDWCAQNSGRFPQNILYYRDGVSDQQYAQVKDEELPQIRAGFDKFVEEVQIQNDEDLAPQTIKLTAVVCTKRHHTRFYPADSKDKQTNGNNNCKPGTLVERSVTSPYFTDFYLQSHNGLKGTAKPAHYFVLVNEMDMKIPDLQHLTYNLCLTYVRATMGVSYAAPAYYADRLCERARCYLRDFFAPPQHKRTELEDRRRDLEQKKGIRPPKSTDKMTPMQKAVERLRVKDVKEQIEKELMRETWESVKRRFYPEDEDEDFDLERFDKLQETMYWM
jgi:eukaryotic translation initiation factor 2C